MYLILLQDPLTCQIECLQTMHGSRESAEAKARDHAGPDSGRVYLVAEVKRVEVGGSVRGPWKADADAYNNGTAPSW